MEPAQGRQPAQISSLLAGRGRRFPVQAAIQFHLDKTVDALELEGHPLHTESRKRGQIERERLLPASVKKAVVLDLIVVEII